MITLKSNDYSFPKKTQAALDKRAAAVKMPKSHHPSPATRARRTALMARTLVEIAQDKGDCTDLDLHQAGFRLGEVIAYGPEARAQAAAIVAKQTP